MMLWKNKVFILIITLISSISQITAWGKYTHMLIFNIAYEKIKGDYKDSIYITGNITSMLKSMPYRNISTIEYAAIPDKLRDLDISSMNTWHYVQLPTNFTNDKRELQHYYPHSALNILVNHLILGQC